MSIARIGALTGSSLSNSALASKKNVTTQNTSFGKSDSFKFKENKTAYIAVGGTVAAIGLILAVKKFPAIKKMMSNFKQNRVLNQEEKKISSLIFDVKIKGTEEVKKIINENTQNGMLNLSGVDEAALMRFADKTRPNHMHESANMIEESCKVAYQKAEPEAGKNMFDKIMFRLENESDALIKVYSEMKPAESSKRAGIFAKEITAIDSSVGMKENTFVEKILSFVESKRKA